MSASVLVDTSVWIDLYRGKDPALSAEIEPLALALKLSTCGIVLTELLNGARSPKDYQLMLHQVGALKFLETTQDVYIKASEIGFAMHRKGLGPALADLVIAATAMVYHQVILTRDSDFERFPGLKVWKV